MEPTNKLRFIERETKDPSAPRTIRILQQLWESAVDIDIITGKRIAEWRDVPLEGDNND